MFSYQLQKSGMSQCCCFVKPRIGVQVLALVLSILSVLLTVAIMGYNIFELIHFHKYYEAHMRYYLMPMWAGEFLGILWLGMALLLPNLLLLAGVRKNNSDYLIPWLFSTFIWIGAMLCLAIIFIVFAVADSSWLFLLPTVLMVVMAVVFSHFWLVVRDLFHTIKRETGPDNIMMNITEVYQVNENVNSDVHEAVNMGYREEKTES